MNKSQNALHGLNESNITAQRAPRKSFRPDINGLRAWAVVAVVLYHFGVPGVSAGFAGVDVFFVISGYLMCSIIVTGLVRDDFSIWSFYLARAKRIFPALVVLCAVTLMIGWFLLMPREYQQLGRHARESLTFSSNLRYFHEAGYFDVASGEKWLLHTWSLSVEWQFYILLPLVLLLAWKFLPKRGVLIGTLVAIFACSLTWCLWRTPLAPNEAFYTIQARAWEMLAGGLVFMTGHQLRLGPGLRRCLELIGFALIVTTFLQFDKHSLWPGWRALLPVTGAALVLLAACERSLWTGSGLAQWLGTRSYSIYLWHWPLVVVLSYLELSAEPLWLAAAVFLSLLLGHLSYVLVEEPSRRWLSAVSVRRGAIVLLGVLLVVAMAAQQVRHKGVPWRLPAEIARIEAERENHNPRIDECLDPGADCIYGDKPVRAILIGDSHADAVVTALQASVPGNGGVLFKGGSGCLIAFGMKSGNNKPECEDLNRQIETTADLLYPGVPLVVVGRMSSYVWGLSKARPSFYFSVPSDEFSEEFLADFRAHYLDTMCRLSRKHPVYVVRPIPEMELDVPTVMGRALLMGKTREVSIPVEAYRKRHAFVWALQDEAVERCGVQLLDPLPYLCGQQNCRSSLEGRPLYRDADHLSEFGNRLLLPMFKQIFEQDLK